MTAALVGASGLMVVNAMARHTVVEEHIFGFKGKEVSMDLTVGEVAIVPGTVDDQILVRRRLTYGLRRPLVEERIDGDTFEIRDGDCAMPVGAICHIKWLLQVPPDLNLSITTTSGNISVKSGMTGAVKLVSTSGDVEARGAAGPAVQLLSHKGSVSGTGLRSSHVVATSNAGDISLTFRSPPKFVQGKAETGFVEVVLPDGEETYKITATAGGSKTIAAKQDDTSSRRIIVDSEEGRVTVRDVSSTEEEAEEQSSATPRS
ncbi:MAG: DUF4097 family beta strand repeat-containing protein [Actinomycetota bacterium]